MVLMNCASRCFAAFYAVFDDFMDMVCSVLLNGLGTRKLYLLSLLQGCFCASDLAKERFLKHILLGKFKPTIYKKPCRIRVWS